MLFNSYPSPPAIFPHTATEPYYPSRGHREYYQKEIPPVTTSDLNIYGDYSNRFDSQVEEELAWDEWICEDIDGKTWSPQHSTSSATSSLPEETGTFYGAGWEVEPLSPIIDASLEIRQDGFDQYHDTCEPEAQIPSGPSSSTTSNDTDRARAVAFKSPGEDLMNVEFQPVRSVRSANKRQTTPKDDSKKPIRSSARLAIQKTSPPINEPPILPKQSTGKVASPRRCRPSKSNAPYLPRPRKYTEGLSDSAVGSPSPFNYQLEDQQKLSDALIEAGVMTNKSEMCPFEWCNELFSRAGDLRRHLDTSKTHESNRKGNPAIRCSLCERDLSRTDARKRHEANGSCGKRRRSLA